MAALQRPPMFPAFMYNMEGCNGLNYELVACPVVRMLPRVAASTKIDCVQDLWGGDAGLECARAELPYS